MDQRPTRPERSSTRKKLWKLARQGCMLGSGRGPSRLPATERSDIATIDASVPVLSDPVGAHLAESSAQNASETTTSPARVRALRRPRTRRSLSHFGRSRLESVLSEGTILSGDSAIETRA